MPKISVVIPLYNKEKHIGRTINSVLSQTFDDFEVVVVNDGSTDGSADVVRGIKDARIRLLSQDNAGETAARNTGIRNARAEICAFLDADDAWEPKFLETILELRDKYPHAGAYATAYMKKGKNGKIRYLKYYRIPAYPWSGIIPNYFRSMLTRSSAVWSAPVCSSAVAVRKLVFDKAGLFPEGEKIGGDQDMWLRIALKYKIAFSNCIGATYFMDAEQRACDLYRKTDKYALVRSAEDAIKNDCVPRDIIYYLKEYANKYRIKSAKNCVLAGKPKLAREHLRDCATRRFLPGKLWWMFWACMPAGFTAGARRFNKLPKDLRKLPETFRKIILS